MKRRAAILGLAASPVAFATSGPPHFKLGGFTGSPTVTRLRVGALPNAPAFNNGALTDALPLKHAIYLMPHHSSALVGQESLSDVTVNSSSQIQINTQGLWRVTACADWPGQAGVDINLRKLAIWRAPVGTNPPFYSPNNNIPNNQPLTQVTDFSGYDRLASQDSPASNVPQYLRYKNVWTPSGQLLPGQYMQMRVALVPNSQITIEPGDVAQASLDFLTDANFGTSVNDLLRLDARVVGPNLVLVRLTNESSNTVVIPANGNVYVVAGTSVATTGNSADAWTTLATSDEYLYTGESIFVTWSSETQGDFIQCSGMTYVQLELLKT
jgi:hypothetical protein